MKIYKIEYSYGMIEGKVFIGANRIENAIKHFNNIRGKSGTKIINIELICDEVFINEN